MSRGAAAADYDSESRNDKVADGRTSCGWRSSDWAVVEELLLLLARAVQQLHTYPPTSPICLGAIEACQRGLVALDRDALSFRVAPYDLTVDEVATGRGTTVEGELARRLHKASVAEVSIDRAASIRELFRFGVGLIRCGEPGAGDTTLQDRLAEHGVERITLRMACRPEVLEVGNPATTALHVMERERARRRSQSARGGVVSHLYPPGKGWVRLDPASPFNGISLVDLAILVDDPAALAAMLLRLTDDEIDETSPDAALEQKYSDVAMLFAALEPRLARQMFSRLALAVLGLESGRRQRLLRRTVLPGLLDGRVDGTVLRDFPDVELAESLCLLLDLETAAPELLTTALSRLDLPAERQAAVLPLLETRLREREATSEPGGRRGPTLTRHARELVRVDPDHGKSFAEFAAFDLSLDARAEAVLRNIRESVATGDVLTDQLTCVLNLTRLEPNPELVQRFVDRAFTLLEALERRRGDELAPWLARYRELAERFRDGRPDVTEVIVSKLEAFCTSQRVAWMADLYTQSAEGRAVAGAVADALGSAIVPPLVGLLARKEAADPRHRAHDTARAVVRIFSERATRLGPDLVPFLGHDNPSVRRAIVRVLGLAGPGYERPLAEQIGTADEQTTREVMRSLARIGTAQAAAAVAAEVEHQRGAIALAAEEALWRFPKVEAEHHVRALLGRREFVLRHPRAVARLLDRASQIGTTGLESVLGWLAPYRFRIWKPSLARVARRAYAMLDR